MFVEKTESRDGFLIIGFPRVIYCTSLNANKIKKTVTTLLSKQHFLLFPGE